MKHRNRSTDEVKSGRLPAPNKIALRDKTRNELRTSIAHSAARLIAEGLTDYRDAKQKAARQHGVTDGQTLPDNREIELALREHLALFAGTTQPRVLSLLRDTAIRVMRQLEHFSPWLVGPVLSGTATEFNEIELELIGVEPKVFEIYLLNVGVDFEHCNMHQAKRASPTRTPLTAKYRLIYDQVPVSIALFDQHTERQALFPLDSIRHDRARRADVERRFLAQDVES